MNSILYNRDLSWLGFNDRVLQEAADNDVPLYERLKFLSIFSSNLDEFFRVRYPSVVALSNLDKKTIKKEHLLTKEDVIKKIHEFIKKQLEQFGAILNGELIPALKDANVQFYYNQSIDHRLKEEITELFLSQVLSFIQPVFLGMEKANNFLPENGKLYLIVTLHNTDKETISHVMVNIPSDKLNRFYVLEPLDGLEQVVFIDDLIRENLSIIFPGQVIQSVYSIKFNRDASLPAADEYNYRLLDKLEKMLGEREIGEATRLLYEKGMPGNLQMYLAQIFHIDPSDFFEGGRYHNLKDLFSFPGFDKTLYYAKQKPILYPQATANGDIFKLMLQKDILLHLPYHSYTPVLSFFNQAAVDVDVTEIYITLYRVAAESHIVNALISAAKNGKKVTAFIELKARFDEANNIKWSRVMKDAGIRLIYSQPTIKVHSKIALVTKRDGKNNVNYALLCTGNFNESTASFYTDHVLLTVDKKICRELQLLFIHLKKKRKSSPGKIEFKQLYVSQFNIIDEFEKHIDDEIKKAQKGLPALIRIKVNNLEESYMINLLYKASQAGVEVRLIVRSICCLIPGKEEMSENIIVKRIVDKFLEHTRLFIFGAGEDAVAIMGSSDLMTRNLRNRIEVCVPLKDEDCKQQIIDYFDLQWQDNTKATMLQPDMSQEKIVNDKTPVRSQQAQYNLLKEIAGHE